MKKYITLYAEIDKHNDISECIIYIAWLVIIYFKEFFKKTKKIWKSNYSLRYIEIMNPIWRPWMHTWKASLIAIAKACV